MSLCFARARCAMGRPAAQSAHLRAARAEKKPPKMKKKLKPSFSMARKGQRQRSSRSKTRKELAAAKLDQLPPSVRRSELNLDESSTPADFAARLRHLIRVKAFRKVQVLNVSSMRFCSVQAAEALVAVLMQNKSHLYSLNLGDPPLIKREIQLYTQVLKVLLDAIVRGRTGLACIFVDDAQCSSGAAAELRDSIMLAVRAQRKARQQRARMEVQKERKSAAKQLRTLPWRDPAARCPSLRPRPRPL